MQNESARYEPNRAAAKPAATSSNVQHIAEEDVDQARDKIDTMVEQGRETVEHARDAAADTLTEIERRIRRKPLQAALIAAGAGFVLALLARR